MGVVFRMTDRVRSIPLSRIFPNPNQPRRYFDPAELARLARSLRRAGRNHSPALVTPRNRKYLLVAGERRWRAAKMAGLRSLRCTVERMTDSQVAELAILDNVQRVDLSPIEEGRSFDRLIHDHGYSVDAIADRLSKSGYYVHRRLALVTITPAVETMLQTRSLSLCHLSAVAQLSPRRQGDAVRHIFRQNLNGEQAERYCRRLVNGDSMPPMFALVAETSPDWTKAPLARVRRYAEQGADVSSLLCTITAHVPDDVLRSLLRVTAEIAKRSERILKEREVG